MKRQSFCFSVEPQNMERQSFCFSAEPLSYVSLALRMELDALRAIAHAFCLTFIPETMASTTRSLVGELLQSLKVQKSHLDLK
jgi:hypothetical protein